MSRNSFHFFLALLSPFSCHLSFSLSQSVWWFYRETHQFTAKRGTQEGLQVIPTSHHQVFFREQKQPHTERHSERCCDKPLIHLFVDLLLIYHSTPTNPHNHIRWDKMALLPDGKRRKRTSVIGVKHMHSNLRPKPSQKPPSTSCTLRSSKRHGQLSHTTHKPDTAVIPTKQAISRPMEN